MSFGDITEILKHINMILWLVNKQRQQSGCFSSLKLSDYGMRMRFLIRHIEFY